MFRLPQLFNACRSSHRLIQAVALAFLLSLGAAVATPALQAANISPDTQIICLGNGGMKTVTFAPDGTATEVQTTHSPNCLLCAALQALPPSPHKVAHISDTSRSNVLLLKRSHIPVFLNLIPPARAPPVLFQV